MEVYTYTYINRYIDTNLMKISLVVISIIIALQATSFIHGAHERFVYHNTIHQSTQHEIYSKSISFTIHQNRHQSSKQVAL
jgi:hypothetical protein